MHTGTRHNPFCVQRLGPAGMDFQPVGDLSVASVTARLASAGWRGELVGPHGAGKSTLLRGIVEGARARGMRVAWWRCTGQARWAPARWMLASARADLVAVDGGERMPATQRAWLRAANRLRGGGLLFTAHEPMGWGIEVRVEPHAGHLEAVLAALLGPGAAGRIDAGREFAAARGDVREALFRLYERWEDDAEFRTRLGQFTFPHVNLKLGASRPTGGC